MESSHSGKISSEATAVLRKHFILANGEVVPNQGQGYFPQDIQRLYHFPSHLTGRGQQVGILEFSNGYSLTSAELFWQSHQISTPQVTFVSVDGTRNDRGVQPQDEEASLDLQWLGALAPQAHILIYEASAGNTYAEFAQSMAQVLQYILEDTTYHPSVLSISYGDAEATFGAMAVQKWADLIAQLDAKGVTVCVATGDQGAYGMHRLNGDPIRHTDAPATSPAAVAVGGTSLQPDGSEMAWTYLGPQNGGATGGGVSNVFCTPEYQTALKLSTRGIPDVALNADPATGYQIVFQGQPAVVGGTSVSTPVFAALLTLVNQLRAETGRSPLSGVTQIIYQQELSLGFRDIVRGNNTFNGVVGYDAVPGWDACTGWGSLDATQWVETLSKLP
ncbi:hypothetical protein D2Q93_07940 [Alicyclobacillaceae bacterium I2511]|nr:hypothetical protein D2Q93_07940 [Alicyclobacillaceae bacterium I2511]